MAIAMLCDICGRTYEIKCGENTCVRVLKGTGVEYHNMQIDKSYDICPTCLNRLSDVANKLSLEVIKR